MPHRRQSNPQPDGQPTPAGPLPWPPSPGRGGTDGGLSSRNANGDLAESVRRLERKRRSLDRSPPGLNGGPSALPLPDDYYARATWASFRLEGLDVSPEEVTDALSQTSAGHALRSRQSQRLRNHAAILHHIESDLRQSTPLSTGGVIRWYTTVSAGLSTTSLNHSATDRLDELVRRINSPQLRLAASIPEIAVVHVALLADPLVPSFNGILARLLLRYHLGRCALPPVVFDPATPAQRLADEPALLPQLLVAIDASYDAILAQRA